MPLYVRLMRILSTKQFNNAAAINYLMDDKQEFNERRTDA